MLRIDARRGLGQRGLADRRRPTGSSRGQEHGWIQLSGGRSYRVARPPARAAAAEHARAGRARSRCRSTSTGGQRRSRARSSASRGRAFWPWRARRRGARRGDRSSRCAGASTRAALTIGLGARRRACRARRGDDLRRPRRADRRRRLAPARSRRSLVAAVLGGLLLRLRGRARVHAAGVVGAVAAAVSLSSLPVFWHGVVISALPATGRACCLRARDRRWASPPRRSASCPTSTSRCA